MSSDDIALQRSIRAGLGGASIRRILRIAREHLDMELVFLAESPDGATLLEFVAAPSSLSNGQRQSASAVPQLRLFDLPAAQARPPSRGLVAPVVLPDGRRCGTLHTRGEVDAAAAERTQRLLGLLAGLTADGLSAELGEREIGDDEFDRVVDLLEVDQLSMVFQPIASLATGRVLGFEALARFAQEPVRPPQAWFARASELGLGVDLELKAIRSALAQLGDIPAPCFLSLNLSATTLCSSGLELALRGVPPERIQLELTEHELVDDYERVNQAIGVLRACGFRLAIDDAGAGYAGLTHILSLAPDVIKLDRAIIRSIDADQARQALASSLVAFGKRVGADIVAEGIETRAEVDALLAIGVDIGQGFHLARPSARPWRALVAP